MSEDEEGEGADLGDDIVIELEYDPSRFFTCDIDIEEYVSGISGHESYVQGIGAGIGRRDGEGEWTYGSTLFSTSSFLSSTLLIVYQLIIYNQ
jgi:hypothetical protein